MFCNHGLRYLRTCSAQLDQLDMRRRRPQGDDGLGEALLPADQEVSEQEGRQWRQQDRQELIVHRPFDLEAFLRFVWERWTALLRAVASCLRGLLGQQAATLSLVQSARLEELQCRVGVPFDQSNALHQEGLRELWDLAFPGSMYPGPKDPKWKDMGWQGTDPTTDFRAAGLLGLDCLLYLGRRQPALFRDLLNKTRGQRSSWEYPFGAAGMNVTWALVEVLKLQQPPAAAAGDSGSDVTGGGGGAVVGTAAGRGFLGLLAAHSSAFEEVYCAAFDLLDRVWLDKKASYMEFNQVLKEVKERVAQALAARPADVDSLRRGLGLPPAPGDGSPGDRG